jgi:hypothetical protein
LLHWLLSKISTLDDVEAVMQEALLEGEINSEQLGPLSDKIRKLIAHPGLEKYFAKNAEIRLEAELITSAGELLRPDRIVISGNEATLIDYKTGQENNKTYFRQLEKYGQALLSMGYGQVKKILVYVDELQVVEVN